MLRGLFLETRHRIMSLKVPGLVRQHLADTSLPAGTIEGLTQSRSHLRPVLNMLRTILFMLRTWRF